MSLGVGLVEWNPVIIRELDMWIISPGNEFCLREVETIVFP